MTSWRAFAVVRRLLLGSLMAACLLLLAARCARGAEPQTAEREGTGAHASAHEARHGEAAHAESSHAEAGHGEETNPLATDPDLAIYTAIVFVILLLILGKFAWRPIAEGLDRREQTIAEQIEAANRTHQEAKNLLAEYEKRLAGAQDEVRAMLDEARRDAAHTSQELLAKANSEAEAIKNRALRDIEIAKGSALKELAESSGRLAIELAGRIVASELNPERHQRLIQEALERFPLGNGNHG
jgi:F-type H+-transporting ATPase subunit b